MQLYEANGNVYAVDEDGKAHGATVTAKDKVVEVRELESITVSPQKVEVRLPEAARPITTDEIRLKFALSEKNPVKFLKSRHDAALKAEQPVEETAAPEE
ncbi:MAG: hypothetical protein J6D54_03885 [Olsenella sp.]|nr:hypothetical protein [Olsenella sp.]